MPAAGAADNLVFVSGAFKRSIPVSDLEHLASTGEARGLLGDVMKLAKQEPDKVADMLNASMSLPIVLVSRLLNTRIGEAILERLAQVIYPLKVPEVGLPALRSGIVLGLRDGDGSLSALTFLRAYPNRDMEVNLPALMALIRKTSSITELVRFFSESPLDGLRGEGQPPSTSSLQAPAPGLSPLDPGS